VLEELVKREGMEKEEKVKKVLDWRSGVGENDDLRGLEEKMARFVERERGILRDIALGSPRKEKNEGLEVEVE
jgi:hypothetical protein